ncbi:MAG: HIT family protein [Cyclobacteriaceae bacterium]|jgi:histidine triad (HIT) family protein
MSSIFSKIIAREIPAHIVLEDDSFIAFLDVMPLVPGHVLVVPKKEVDYIFDLEDDDFGPMMIFAKKVAKALRKAVTCRRIGISVIGLEVPHTHVHLVPMNSADDVNFTRPKLKPSSEELIQMAERIRSAF